MTVFHCPMCNMESDDALEMGNHILGHPLYAVVRIRSKFSAKGAGDTFVVRWPHEDSEHLIIELRAGPFDSLAEAQHAARQILIPEEWRAYDIWSEPAA